MSETHAPLLFASLNFCIALGMLLFYVLYSRKIQFPMIQFPLFHYRTFSISVFGNIFARLGFGGMPFLLPLMQQVCFGFSPQLSGLLLIPIAVGIMSFKSIASKLLRKLGYRRYLLINTILVS